MASQTPTALAHRVRQALTARSQEWIAEDEAGNAFRNGVEFIHGLPCTNRAEKRKALGTAKKYGCDERGKEHNKRCPLFKIQKALETAKAAATDMPEFPPVKPAELAGPAANDEPMRDALLEAVSA